MSRRASGVVLMLLAGPIACDAAKDVGDRLFAMIDGLGEPESEPEHHEPEPAKSESEPEAKAEPEPEPESEAEPEPESEYETASESEAEPESVPESEAEPGDGEPLEAGVVSGGGCLDGGWRLADLDPWLAPEVRRQAQGRPVHRMGGKGEVTLRFDPTASTVDTTVEEVRARYRAKLANIKVVYALELSGSLTSSYRLEGERLVVEAPAGELSKGSEVVTFDGKRTERRTVSPSFAGTFTVSCTETEAVLRREATETDEAPITLLRLKS